MNHLPNGVLGTIRTQATVTTIDEYTFERYHWQDDFPPPSDLEMYAAQSF